MQRKAPTIIVMALVVAGVLVRPAAAQIINTLRGFDDQERGWSGKIAGGVALADGNTEFFEFELDGKIQYQADRHRWRAIGINARRTARGVEVAESRSIHFRHNYRLRPRVFSIAFVQGQYNPFLRIETRILVGAGARVEVLQRAAWKSAVGVALMHESEELTSQVGEFSTRYRVSSFFTLYRVEKKAVDIDIWGFYQPLVDEFTDARVSGAASAKVKLGEGLFFLVSYVAKHDSDPPAGVKGLDQVLRSGLGWDF